MPPRHRKPTGTGTSVEIGQEQLSNLQTQIDFTSEDTHKHVVTLAGGIGDMAKDLDGTKADLNVVANDVQTVNGKVDTLDTDLKAVDDKVTAVDAKVDDINNKVNTLEVSIDSMKLVG